MYLIYLFIYLFILFIGLKHTNHAIKHNMSRSMYRTLTDMSKITSASSSAGSAQTLNSFSVDLRTHWPPKLGPVGTYGEFVRTAFRFTL